MLRKLLKYELAATARKFFPIYGGIIAASVLTNIAINFYISNLFRVIIIIVLAALFAALGVLTVLTVIQRFKDNLFGDEGYLMFTIPAMPEKIILSKVLTALLWAIASVLMTIISIFIVFLNRDMISTIEEIFMQLGPFLGNIEREHIISAVLIMAGMITQYIYLVLTIYTSLSIGQIQSFIKRRGLVSFGAFMAISVLTSIITQRVFTWIFPVTYTSYSPELNVMFTCAIFANLFLGAVMFGITSYIMRKHLNIE